jgi:hypothetical protein
MQIENKIFAGKPKEKEHLGDQALNARIIAK